MIAFNGQFSEGDLAATLQALGTDISFVQIGAMDGVTHDPIYPFVSRLHWKGLLVEPIPYLHEKLKENYANCEHLVFERCAIADFEGMIEMAYLDPARVEPNIFAPGAFGTSTLMRDRGRLSAQQGTPQVAEMVARNISVIEVPCCRLKTLLIKHATTKIDLLVIDAEGADWMIARQLDLETYQPRVVYLEYDHLTDYEKIACAHHFRNHGYRLYLDQVKGENFMAIRS